MMMGAGLYLAKNIFKTINIYIKSRYKYNYEMHNEIREEINREIERIHKNKKILNIITYPYRVLARNISEDDILVLPACKTDKESINNIILRDLSGIKTVYCDGDFYFHWIDVGGKRIATISNDHVALHTKVRVDYNDYNYLLKMDEKNIKCPLNINLRHIDNMYIDSIVVGVDKPRRHKELFCISNFINQID
ncbi:hypothetical protein [Desulfovibrio fairfieldensis]|uniref:hypothetical protein n=1 Tax=Desulfovibrio fairfieldensis TaxID=44742 RepID=UPI000A98B6B2|nr:hypothetical protein [Desulfovibrio fairfieldensis]